MLRSSFFDKMISDYLLFVYNKKKATPEQIRSSFDAEIAFLMTFFKMNIDVRNINAAVYANIVHQADVEISMKKKRT